MYLAFHQVDSIPAQRRHLRQPKPLEECELKECGIDPAGPVRCLVQVGNDAVRFIQGERADLLSRSLGSVYRRGRVLLDQFFSYCCFQNRRQFDQGVTPNTWRCPLRGRNDAAKECGGDLIYADQCQWRNPVQIQCTFVVVARAGCDDSTIKPIPRVRSTCDWILNRDAGAAEL